jgi:Bax protein
VNLPAAAFGASARWLRRTPWARRSLLGAAVLGTGCWIWRAASDEPLPDFTQAETTAEKKAAFFDFLLPQVRAVNAAIAADRRRLLRVRDELARDGAAGVFDGHWLRGLAEDYELEPPARPDAAFAEQLLRRVDVIAPSLVLAQAANESAWGTSRFARHGNNLFGMRTWDGEGLVPHHRAAGKTFKVAVYDSVRDSLTDYVHNLNTNERYRHLRQIRADLRRHGQPVTGLALANGLRAYSKLGDDYIGNIQDLIRSNRLERDD